jgi:hypothetical protein
MIQQTSRAASFPPSLNDWGAYEGHGGDTYGFLSEQGRIPQLNASFSVVANEDGDGNFVKESFACGVIQIAGRLYGGQPDLDLKCGS